MQGPRGKEARNKIGAVGKEGDADRVSSYHINLPNKVLHGPQGINRACMSACALFARRTFSDFV